MQTRTATRTTDVAADRLAPEAPRTDCNACVQVTHTRVMATVELRVGNSVLRLCAACARATRDALHEVL
jgi:hypothetical protein